MADGLTSGILADNAIVRARLQSAAAQKKDAETRALDRSRDGRPGDPIRMKLTRGKRLDIAQVEALLKGDRAPSDKGH